jgi:hypothetical protein
LIPALQPDRPVYDTAHPLGCHKPRIADRIIFEKLIQVLRFGCSLRADRRLHLRGYHDPRLPRRVSQGRDLREAEVDRVAVL